MEYQDNNYSNLTLEQIEKLIEQTKAEIMQLQKDVIEKNNYLLELLAMTS